VPALASGTGFFFELAIKWKSEGNTKGGNGKKINGPKRRLAER